MTAIAPAPAPAPGENFPPSTVESPPRSVQQRFDFYGPIHKSLRMAISDLLIRMGKTNFAAPEAAERVVSAMRQLLVVCEEHIEHEARFVHPQLATRLPQALAKIDAGHDEHARFVAELRSLGDAVLGSKAPSLRALAGRTLYLHFTSFAADALAHMVEEERALQPLMHRFFSDDELLAMETAILGSMSPEQQLASMIGIVRAVNGPERAALLGGVHAAAPPPAFEAIIGALRPELASDEWSELTALCPFLGERT